MTLQNSDNFVVNRSSVNYSIESEKLVATLEDTDLMVVGRGSTPYKITGKEVKDSLGGGGIFPSDNDLTVSPSVPGSGTELDPYILTIRTAAPAGSTILTSETITFTAQPPDTNVVWTDNSTGAGTRFNQPVTQTDSNGLWSGQLQYADVPDSTQDVVYVGDLQIGVLYFRWTVDQRLVAEVPTVVNSVLLVESSPEGDRFTNSEFVFTSDIDDGIPLAEKTFDAYVSGTFDTEITPRTSAVVSENSAIVHGDWNAAPAAQANGWMAVTYGDNKFVAVAKDGNNRVMYSTDDAISWTAASATEANSWESVIYGNGKFVAVASNGTNRVMYSTDGISWTAASATEASSWYSVTYGNGKFVAVAGGGTNRVMWSTDGISWTSASATEANSWRSVTYGNGKFVAVSEGGTNRVMYSTDGISWTAASAAEANGWYSVTYGNGKFVAISSDGTNQVMWSTDAISWTSASAADDNSWNTVTYGSGMFVAVSWTGTNQVMWSTDAISWTSASAAESNFWESVTYGNGKFVSVGQSGTNRVMWSISGTTQTLTLTDNKTYNAADNADTGLTVSEAFTAGDSVTAAAPSVATGTVASAVDNVLSLNDVTGTWAVGDYAVGPETIKQTTKLYLDFNSSGDVSSLRLVPMDPPYTTSATNPGLTLTFPPVFPTGNTPDDELGPNTVLTVGVASENSNSRSPATGFEEASVQPTGDPSVDDMFSTTLYAGTDTPQTITNGVNLAGDGGLVWIKNRSLATSHMLNDTARGAGKRLMTNSTTAEFPLPEFESFNSNGFNLGVDSSINSSGYDYASFSFRKAPNFFDIQTWTGTGGAATLPHALTTTPGFIIAKSRSEEVDWWVYHKAVGKDDYLRLNLTNAAVGGTAWDDTAPTATEFTVGSISNGLNKEYVAYLFADTPGLIKCGGYAGVGVGTTVSCGFEPQWVMLKNATMTDSDCNWAILDNKRFWNGTDNAALAANLSTQEGGVTISDQDYITFTSDGFVLNRSSNMTNVGSQNFIYVAIAAPVVETMTVQQFAAAQASFLTYENREQIKLGEEAINARDQVIDEVKDQLARNQANHALGK